MPSDYSFCKLRQAWLIRVIKNKEFASKILKKMKIQLNTDKNIQGTENFKAFVSESINSKLKRYADKITRIEVHLSDQNAQKAGTDDIQCKIEARIEGLQPILATAKGSTKEKALNDAVDKVRASLDTIIGKMKEK